MVYMASTEKWYLERIIWLVAGTFTLVGSMGALFHNPLWLILTALVGINLLIFAFSGFCIMANILYALGARPKTGGGARSPIESSDAIALRTERN